MSNPGFKTVYLYDAQGLYDGPYEAQESPLELGVYLLPGQCLDTAPIIAAGTWPVCTSGAWVNEPDFRGQVFYNTDGIAITINALGSVPAGLLAAPPAPTLAAVQASQIALLQAAYQTAINAPVSYTTISGTAANFPQDATSVSNLQKAITGALSSQSWPLNLWLDVNGSSVMPFTFADLEKLAAAMESADVPEYAILLAKISAVMTATTITQVQAVTW